MTKIFRATLLTLCFTAFMTTVNAEAVTIESKPVDMVEFTCEEFKEKIKNCDPYSCQTPFIGDPTVKMRWKILDKKNNRCVISHTTQDIGLKDSNDNPMPITQTCEYDESGIQILIELMQDMQKGYFHSWIGDDNNSAGIHNCRFSSNGQPIKSIQSLDP